MNKRKIYFVYKYLKTIFHNINLVVFGQTYVCRHNPSCSRYMVLQIKQHGTILGLWRGLRRIIACSLSPNYV